VAVTPEHGQAMSGGADVLATHVPTEDAQELRPKLSDEQLATLNQYGTVEETTVGQVLFSAGDPTYDLIVLL
jgi:hypothetical protein